MQLLKYLFIVSKCKSIQPDLKISKQAIYKRLDEISDLWSGLGGRNARSILKIQASYIFLSKSITSKELSKYEIELLACNIISTNVSVDMLSASAICDLYRARC